MSLWPPERPAWQADARCRGLDPAYFFHGRGESMAEARAACFACPVRIECLEYALERGEKFGMWGGLSERQRRRVRARRRLAAVS